MFFIRVSPPPDVVNLSQLESTNHMGVVLNSDHFLHEVGNEGNERGQFIGELPGLGADYLVEEVATVA